MAYFYRPDCTRFPKAGEDIPQKVISDLARQLYRDAHVLVGSHPADGNETAEVDLIVITHHPLHVVEVKNLSERLFISADGPWYEQLGSGRRQRVKGNRRGEGVIVHLMLRRRRRCGTRGAG